MSKAKKITLIAAGVSVIAGMIMMTIALLGAGFNLSTDSLKDSEVTISEAFDNISVDLESAKVMLKPSDDKQCRIQFHEWESQKFAAEVKDKTLQIRYENERTWLDRLFFRFGKPSVTLYLPDKTYQSLNIRTVTGSIQLSEALSFKNLSVKSVTSDVTCDCAVSETAEIKAVTGSICLNNVKAKTIKVDVTTGSISLDRCDAETISARTVTGDISGTLLTGKTFRATTTTGRINVPDSTSGGSCELTTTTGSIKIELAE